MKRPSTVYGCVTSGPDLPEEERQARHRSLSYGKQPFSRVTQQDLASYQYSGGEISTLHSGI